MYLKPLEKDYREDSKVCLGYAKEIRLYPEAN